MKAQTRARNAAQRQAWKTYRAACDTRHDHVHVDCCPTCWDGRNSECAAWRAMTDVIDGALDVWSKL